MEPLLVYPDPPPPELAQTLDLGGYAWKAVADEAAVARIETRRRCGAAPSWCWATHPETGLGRLPGAAQARRAARAAAAAGARGAAWPTSSCATTSSTTSASTPFHPRELEARLRHLFWRTGTGTGPELIEYGDLVLNLETYQAAIDGQPLDLTYMEYELLKFLAQHPGKVFTRETLLSRVWGYEYYGGARTVDVHIRRLRAKLGEEHAGLIQTVRSVGYRFGQSRWAAS